MKIDVASLNNDAKSKGKAEPALPLFPIDTSDQQEREMISLTLAVNPADPDSPKYKAKFLVLKGDEDVRTMLLWREDVAKIITGMAIGPGQNRKQMIDGLLKGTPRTLFDSAVDIHANQRRTTRARAAADDQARARVEAKTLVQNYTNNVINLAIKQMLTQLMPRRILAQSKRLTGKFTFLEFESSGGNDIFWLHIKDGRVGHLDPRIHRLYVD